MPTPVAEKTWQSSVNVVLPLRGANLPWSQTLMWAIKDALIGFASNPWIVRLSSDSVNAGAADYWVDYQDLIWGANTTSDRSWIVLGQDGINTGFEVLIDLVGANSVIDIWVSEAAGFTGGSKSLRPSAADEVECFPGESKLWGGGNIDKGGRCHVLMSTDGECTRIFNTYLYFDTHKYAGTFWLIDKPKNPVDHWTNPWVMFLASHNGNLAACTREVLSNVDSNGQANISGAARDMAIIGPTVLNSSPGQTWPIADEVSGEWPFWRAALWCGDASYRGTKGELFDAWWGVNDDYLSLRTYPEDGSAPEFVHFEDMTFAWDGATPPILT